MEWEKVFDITILDHDIESMATIGDTYTFLEKSLLVARTAK